MKKVGHFFALFASIFAVILFASCEVGMGQALDLEAPEITITSPSDGDNLPKSVHLEGTCKDNIKVTSIIIEEKTNDDSLVKVGEGVVTGNTWYADITLEEGDRFLICTAKDYAGNSGAKSKAVVTIIVDETAPEGKNWTVDRGNNKQTKLMELNKLKSLDLGLAVNKFVPQNEEFTINGQMSDSVSVSKLKLILKEVPEDPDAEDIEIISKENFEGGIYTPAWKFTHNELVAQRPELETGKHYLKVIYVAEDEAGNVKDEDDGKGGRRQATAGYLLWWPESDAPGIEQSKTDENDKLLVNAGSTIPLNFFDDDYIVEYGYDFIKESKLGSTTKDDVDSYLKNGNKIKNPSVSDATDEKVAVSTLDDTGKAMPSGKYYLLAYVKEKNEITATRLIEVSLMDAAKPMLIIETPLENEAPTVVSGPDGTASTFKFIGQSYDTSGCKDIKIAYIPDSAEYDTAAKKQERAKKLFEDETLKSQTEIVKTFQFNPIGQKPAADKNDNLIKERFEFTFDLLTDFPNEMNKKKFFFLMVTDIDNNKVYKQMIVEADTDKPEIEIELPADDMAVIDYSHNDLKFKFKAVKDSGLGIDPESYKLTRKDTELVYTFASGDLSWDDAQGKNYVVATIGKEELDKWANGKDGFKADIQPVFIFEATDILGNKGTGTRTVVLSPLPTLESVTVDQANGTYCAGQKLTFQAKFSDTVKVTGTPRLKLKGIKQKKSDTAGSVDVIRYATYKSDNMNSDTMKFEYTIAENEVAQAISCDLEEIDLNGGKIETGTQGTGNATIKFVTGNNFWDSTNLSVKKTIGIDGIRPRISNVSAVVTGVKADADSYSYGKEATEVLVTVEFTEPVSISGTVNLKVNNLNFVQYSMAENAKSVTYSYLVGSNKNGNTKTAFNNEKLVCAPTSCFTLNGSNSIKDRYGNELLVTKNENNNDVVESTYNIGVILDTSKPKVPTVNGITEEVYNKPPKFTVTKNSTDADIKKLEVSIDNGATWIDYTGKEEPKKGAPWHWVKVDNEDKLEIITGGTYYIIAKATDKAGNISDNSQAQRIMLNDQFPEILDIKVACENGNYKKGDKLTFKVFLSDTVKPFNAGDATLTFATINPRTGSTPRTVNVKASPKAEDGTDTPTTILEFEHKVTDGTLSNGSRVGADLFNGIRITGITLNTIQDKYNNKQSDKTAARIEALVGDTTGGCYRQDIKVDGVAPTVASTAPRNNNVVTRDDSTGYLTVKLTFDEPVYKESGTITLQRKGNWAIPAVMTVDEFNRVYNNANLTAEDREKLMCTVGGQGYGNELVDARTGIPAGPYKKITHGLTVEQSTGVLTSGAPDKDTKYVLDFNLGLYSGSTTIDPYGKKIGVTVDQIRAVFEKTGYHKHTLQMNSSNITPSADNKTYTITFPEKIQEGIEWELIVSDGAFRDEVGNLYGGMGLRNASGTILAGVPEYTLWSDKVAAPVVRVDRYSHGYGAIEPKSTDANVLYTEANKAKFVDINTYVYAGKNINTTNNNDIEKKSISFNTATVKGGLTAPTGYVRVRIDCQTPDAKLYYKEFNTGAFDSITGKVASSSGSDSIKWTKWRIGDSGTYDGINYAEATGTSTANSAGNYLFNDNTNQSKRSSVSEIVDATAAQLTGTTGFTEFNQINNGGKILVVGDGAYSTARKDYVVAYATKVTQKKDSNESMANSINGAEGIFKTVIYSTNYQDSGKQFNIEGGTFMGGEPSVSGFPVRDGESSQYSKNAYNINNNGNFTMDNIWVSYEIVSTNWAILLREGANSKNYPRSSYGQASYICGFIHY